MVAGPRWRTACRRNPNINVVYTINEPAANGANTALTAAGKSGVLIVSVDGGCAGVELVKSGVIGATSQQYPLKMAELGVQAIYDLATSGKKPAVSEGLDFYNTGVALVTDKAATGVDQHLLGRRREDLLGLISLSSSRSGAAVSSRPPRCVPGSGGPSRRPAVKLD